MAYAFSAGDTPTSRYFPETGCRVEGAFLDFFDRFGVDLCGLPITNRVVEGGIPTQYFQRLALEEPTPGQVRLKALGDEVLRLRQERPTPLGSAGPLPATRLLGPVPFALVNQMDRLPQHPTARYPGRPLEHIRHLIIHHTGVPASVGLDVIAGYHVTDLNWPGIGYHFVVDAMGQVYQTNALTTAAYHARQFNSSGIGIALLGNFTQAVPPPEQLDGVAELCAWLLQGLNLPLDAIRGHRELVAVTCPGEYWLQGAVWKESLVARVAGLLQGERPSDPAPLAAPAGVASADRLVQADAPVPTAAPLAVPAVAAALASASTSRADEEEAARAPAPVAATWTEPTEAPAPADMAATAHVETVAESAPVAPVVPLAPTTWAESAEQSVATAAMVAALTPPAPVAPTEGAVSEATTTAAPPLDTPTATPPAPPPAPRPWWMPVNEPFPAPEGVASAEPSPTVGDTVPLDVTPLNEAPAGSGNGLEGAMSPAPVPPTAGAAQAHVGQPETPATDDEDIPFFPRPRPDAGQSQ